MTVPEAGECLGYRWEEIDCDMSDEMRSLFIDASIFAKYAEAVFENIGEASGR